MSDYKTIAESRNFIVLDKYTKDWQVNESYQSEGDLEREFIQDLVHQGYEAPPGLNTPEALLAEAELRECLEKTIASLSEMQSSVLLLRERQGLDPEEICNLLDLSLSNVRVLLHRARLKVFATLEHFEETGQC